MMGQFRSQATGAFGNAAPATGPSERFDSNPGKIIVPTKVVQNAFKKVFMEDLIVLLMFFGLMGMCLLSWMGPATLDSGRNACNVSAGSASCGYWFFWVPAIYTFLYMKCP